MYRDDYPEIDLNDNKIKPVEVKGCLIYIGIMFIVLVSMIILTAIEQCSN